MKKVAVVILNWNGRKLLEQFLPSVVANSALATVYVADNASDDDSISYLAAHFPEVKIIRNASNWGFAKGYNEALKYVEEEIYALVNSDVEVTPNWLEPVVEMFESEPETAIVQPKIRDFRNKEYFEYAGAAGGFIDSFGYPFCRGRIFGTLEKDHGQYDDNIDIFWASGACLFIRKNVFHDLKCFDADFFAHQEEIDLCWRAINKNHKVRYCSKSLVYHLGGATLSNQNARKTYLNFRNSLAMLVKNLPQHKLLFIILSRLVLDGLAGVRFLAKGQFTHILAIVKAHFYFYGNFDRNYDKRSMFQKRNYYCVKNVAFDYFLRKKITFKELF
ncbi:MAG: glycosyltransferase family 2 protein [Flavobacterium sp.]|nr:MAG: glycosyltransferase family 2 protein [Flavobacterium sp.]